MTGLSAAQTAVTLTGTGFTPETKLRFGQSLLLDINFLSSLSITASIPTNGSMIGTYYFSVSTVDPDVFLSSNVALTIVDLGNITTIPFDYPLI